ncbi:MAG: DMT family transporter [Hyphomicrobiaceae bacterium]
MTATSEPDTRARENSGYILGAIGVFIFGLTLPMTRMAVVDFDPVFVGLGRAILAAAIAAAILIATRQPWPKRTDLKPLLITSAGVVLGFPLLATTAMLYVPAAHGGVVIAVLPLATAVAGVIFAGERPSLGFWLCAIAGSLAVLTFSILDGGGITDAGYADLLLAAAVVSAAIGYAQGGVLSRALGGWQVICWALVIAVPILVPIVWWFSGPINWNASLPAWTGFLYVAVLSQLVGFFAWNAGLARGGIAKVGQLQLFQAFVTIAAAAVLLGERITWLQVGFAVLVVAIVMIGRRMQVR